MTTFPCGVLLAQKHGARHLPNWFEWEIAGYSFAYDEKHSTVAIYDPKTKYMLLRQVECEAPT